MTRCMWDDKKCYTLEEAQATLSRIRAIYTRGSNIPQRMYFCERCKHYHLTHLKHTHIPVEERMRDLSKARKAKKYQRKNLLYTEYEAITP